MASYSQAVYLHVRQHTFSSMPLIGT